MKSNNALLAQVVLLLVFKRQALVEEDKTLSSKQNADSSRFRCNIIVDIVPHRLMSLRRLQNCVSWASDRTYKMPAPSHLLIGGTSTSLLERCGCTRRPVGQAVHETASIRIIRHLGIVNGICFIVNLPPSHVAA